MQYRNLSLGFLIPTVQYCGGRSLQMEFLDINLTKEWSLLLYTLLWFLKSLQKIRETRKLDSIHDQHFVERKNEGRKKTGEKLESDTTRVYAQKSRIKMLFKNSTSVHIKHPCKDIWRNPPVRRCFI